MWVMGQIQQMHADEAIKRHGVGGLWKFCLKFEIDRDAATEEDNRTSPLPPLARVCMRCMQV
jgi:hypothetical protein